MDRRSWLWRRKSSEKSTGETESSGSGSGSGSGSISSPSERFSDDQQAYANLISQSTEIPSKVVAEDEVNDRLIILREKLCDALANVSAKEELVQQHAKVAEEAVTGWEKAEKEATSLNQQLNASTKINSSLEDRIVHLDSALKECLRQLRQVREEQDHKIQEAIAKNSQDSESKSSTQLADLYVQLQHANAKLEAFSSSESDLHERLGSAEKKNASLQLKLQTLLEELEIRTLERDLSTKTAETASKQHLESIKKVAKLEAECRRLKTVARKATSFNDHKSAFETPPGRSSTTPSDKIVLMDDFLEMERLAALPVRENRTTELEKKIEMFKVQNQELGIVLTDHQDQLRLSEASLRKLQAKFNECETQLMISQAQLQDANNKLGTLQSELDLANDLRQAIELELEDAHVRKQDVESHLCKLNLLENVAEKERARYAEISAKCRALDEQLSKTKLEAASANTSKETVEKELEIISTKKYSVESQLRAAEVEAKSLRAKVGSLEREVEKERLLSTEFSSKCNRLEDEVSKLKRGAQLRLAPKTKEELDIQQEKELSVAAANLAECQKTIASLGKQLKSIATFDELFLESEKVTEKESQHAQNCEKPANLPTGNKVIREYSALPSEIIRDSREAKYGKEGLSFVMPPDKSRFRKLFPRSKSAMRSR